MMTSHLPYCPPWTLRSWPPVLWQLGARPRLQLRHVGTHVTHNGDEISPLAGQTIWASQAADGEAGLAWDWVQLPLGILALADPMAVVSNLRIIGPEGEVLTAYEAVKHLNALVNALPWQDEVERALSTTLN